MKRLLPVLIALMFFTSVSMASEYAIMPGDVLSISILGFPEYTENVTVMPNGVISLQFGIDLKVRGLTPSMVREMITIEYSEYLRNPIVTVKVVSFHKISITVVGEVKSPGRYDFEPSFRPAPTVSEAIGMAGGLLPRADAKMITLIRDKGQDAGMKYFDMDAFNETGDVSTNYTLCDGDFLFVPEKTAEVLVLGEVKKPGSYAYTAKTTILDLIAEAGGLTEKGNSRIVHTRNVDGNALVTEVDLEIIMQNKLDSSNKIVQAGDIIVIPEVQKVTVQGALGIVSLIKNLLDIFNITR